MFFSVLCFICGISSYHHYNSIRKQVYFLSEAEQAITVGAAKNALLRGIPWLEEHLADSAELRIWQSNLDYLNQQPESTLVAPEMKQSISKNINAIDNNSAAGKFWMYITILFAFGTITNLCSFYLLSNEFR